VLRSASLTAQATARRHTLNHFIHARGCGGGGGGGAAAGGGATICGDFDAPKYVHTYFDFLTIIFFLILIL
jgi:hypothetical protein